MKTLILCVDDDTELLEQLTRLLEDAGYSVICAENGFDALALAVSTKPSLILLDLMLPDLTGIEVCRRLRSHLTTSAIPIIMLTVKDDEMDKVIGLEIGADDYVTKPFSAQILVARIKALLRRHDMEADLPALDA